DRTGRPGDNRHGAGRQSRRDPRHRHRVGDSGRPAVGDLRRFRHDQTTRPRLGPRDLEAHRRTARRYYRRRQRRRTWNVVHAAVPGPRRSIGAGRRKLRVDESRRYPAAAGHPGGGAMFRTLVKTDAVAVDDRTVLVRYFELRTLRGARRYSAEILLGPGDRITLDDDSVTNLEARTACLVPATLYSRMLARPTAA